MRPGILLFNWWQTETDLFEHKTPLRQLLLSLFVLLDKEQSIMSVVVSVSFGNYVSRNFYWFLGVLSFTLHFLSIVLVIDNCTQYSTINMYTLIVFS